MRISWRSSDPFRPLLALVILAASVASAPLLAQTADRDPVIMVGTVSYVSGGVGDESREHLQSIAASFNLKLLLAGTSGEFLANVQVQIFGKDGKPVVQAVSEGPIFMARLPPGSYRITATADGVVREQKVVLGNGQRNTLHFRWPSSY
ncbi:MAG: carboxypeptidase-like regulatory domain-containing protein [Rhodocyclaceae bacterium]